MADIINLVKTEFSRLQKEKRLSEIAERDSDFVHALIEHRAGILSADELRETAAAFAALVLAMAEKAINDRLTA